ncbi:unnamed protein product, partial [Brassica rapa subsp. trilocularis]
MVTSWIRGYICINGFLYFGGYSQCSWGFRHHSVRRIHTFIDFVE